MQFRRRLGAWLASAASAGLLACPHATLAQSAPVVSRPVVQAMPSATSVRLSAALSRIARDPRDYSALVDAGDAANAMGDPEAAAGFYRRADSIAPNNPRIKAGLARALVLQGNPAEAIPLFAVAETGGAGLDVTADRGLAYDLVGDTVTAQKYYRAALARKDDDEVRRRLGISMAISGDGSGSDAMLMPLLRKQDKPAWRAQAFALAIAGKTKEAVDTVNAILPPTLAQSVTPYLRYMPRLTRAQQAAAVNLGKFPRASEMGRDDPAIAAYAPTPARVAAADAALIPRGKALGSGQKRTASAADAAAAPLTSSQRRARAKAARLARVEADQAARVAPPDPKPAIDRDSSGELPPVPSTAMTELRGFAAGPASAPLPTERAMAPTSTPRASTPPRTSVAARTPAPTATRVTALSPSVRTSVAQPSVASLPPARTATLTLPPSTTATPPAAATYGASANGALASNAPANNAPAREAVAAAPNSGFDLARLGSSSPATAQQSTAAMLAAATPGGTPAATPVSAPAAPLPSSPPPAPSSVSLDQVFADLGSPSRVAAPVAGAVDVRAIAPIKLAAVTSSDTPKPETAKPDTAKPTSKKAQDTKAAAEELAADKKKLADAGKGKKAEAKKPEVKKPDAKKVVPSHPSRIWVQIGVGRNEAAIAYDWRKSVKDNAALFKGRKASTSDMGRTNRVLVGPFETQKAATAFVAQAKKAKFDGAFVWTSPAGQVVDALAAK